jgi:predicted phage terminase large subunit-like protein
MDNISTKELLLEDFNLYRRYMFSGTIFGEWQDVAGNSFNDFHKSMINEDLPALLLSSHPQSGKSTLAIQYASWFMVKNPLTAQVAYSSVSHSLCKKAIRNLRRIIFSKRFQKVFGDLNVTKNTDTKIEFGINGMFLATTVGGQIVGETIQLVIIDDPHKNRAESRSLTIKEKVKDWFDNDVSTRLTKDGGILSIQTRWAVDDLYNHIATVYPDSKHLNFKAIDEQGNALFPELKPLSFLLKRKSAMHPLDWASLYQGEPTYSGGEMLDMEAIRYYNNPPDLWKMRFIVADTASTAKNYSDYTVFGFFGITPKLELYLLNFKRFKTETPKLESEAVEFWKQSKGAQFFAIENKSSGIGLLQALKLKSLPIRSIERGTGQGIVDRALDYGSVISQGKLYLPEHIRHNTDIITELTAFPNAPHDDFVSVLLDGMQELNKLLTVDNVTFTNNNLNRSR